MIIDEFVTPLGKIEFSIDFLAQTSVEIEESINAKHIASPHQIIRIIDFDCLSEWWKDTMFPVEKTKGWIVIITKKTAQIEQIKIKCELTDNHKPVFSLPDGGEHLDAIWIESKTHFLSIGTEDGETLRTRALQNDYMPMRFANQLGYQSIEWSFTKYLELGFETILPNLEKGEKVYLHYLVAFNPRKKSIEYPETNDISTNLIVDYPKRVLIEKLKISE